MRRILIICLLLFASIAGAGSLQWNASVVDETHGAPTGYRIQRCTAPGVYDWQIDVGNVLQWPIPDDLYGSYYWTASAYNSAGSSGYSNDVFWQRAPPEPPQYVGATNLRASKLQTIGNGMGFSYIANVQGSSDSSGTSLDATSALNVQAGDLLVAWCTWEDGDSTLGVADSDGSTNIFTMETVNNSNADCYGAFGYRLSAQADETATFRMTLGTARGYRRFIVLQFRPDSGETVSKAAGPSYTASSGGTTAQSGNISPSGDDLVVVGGIKVYNSRTFSNAQINDSAATGGPYGALLIQNWYSLFNSGFSNGHAQIDASVAYGVYLIDVIAFSSASASGTSAVPVFMRYYKARRE